MSAAVLASTSTTLRPSRLRAPAAGATRRARSCPRAAASAPEPPAGRRRARALPARAGALLALAPLLLAAPPPAAAAPQLLQDGVASLEAAVQAAGPAGPALYVLAYVAAAVLLVPGSLLTLAAGFLYGPLWGTALVSAASTAGAAAAFLVGRSLARPLVEARLSGSARLAALDAALAAEGARVVFLLRLSPLFPYSLLNYGLSLSGVRFWPYVAASWAGMLPGTVAYVALGGAGRAAAESAAGGGAGPATLALYAVGAAATLWATGLVSRAAARALDEAAAQGGGEGSPLAGGDRADRSES